jgi:hypothetical protein
MTHLSPMKTPELPLYAQYGLDSKQWTALALLTNRVGAAGIEVTGIAKLMPNDPKAGCELIYSRGKQAIVLGVSSQDGRVILAFHRTLDSAIPERVCQGELANWSALASTMLYYR